jgi:hypothetical protein
MGTDISAKLIAGIRVQKEVVSKVITKYNEDTGKPYHKEEDDSYYMVGDTRMDYGDIEDHFDSDSELDYFHEQESDEYMVIGVLVADTGSNRSANPEAIIPKSFDEVKAKMELAEKLLSKYNVPKNEILLCLISDISY